MLCGPLESYVCASEGSKTRHLPCRVDRLPGSKALVEREGTCSPSPEASHTRAETTYFIMKQSYSDSS